MNYLNMNNLKKVLTLSFVALTFSIGVSQSLSDAELVASGTKIGQAYHQALTAGDVAAQNDALNQFNEILATLRRQQQVDLFSNAFTHSNIHLTTPEKDARLYSRAVIKALRANDSIGVEDAYAIAFTVGQRYYSEAPADTAAMFESYYKTAITSSLHGYNKSVAVDVARRDDISRQASEERNIYATDSVTAKLWDDCFDFHSINLSSVEEDAIRYADMLKTASKSGEQTQLDAVARIIGFVYERYYLDRSADEAKQFNARVNELVEVQ